MKIIINKYFWENLFLIIDVCLIYFKLHSLKNLIACLKHFKAVFLSDKIKHKPSLIRY